ncbi:hypothetical protein [Citromicrobium bathyomarinum]|uniref:tetratricopeptide repeat protein n=1 Tax=Citromicrobium bathyomarinum TaxID=72174 RepID=UPI00315ADA3D
MVGLLLAPKFAPESPEEPHYSARDLPRAGYGSASQREAETRARKRIEYATELAAARPGQWLPKQVLARALRSRYLVDGNPDALRDAGLQLAAARADAADGSGPGLISAEWSMEVHDLVGAEAGLAAYDKGVVKLSTGEQATALELRGDINFYRGDLSAAERLYGAARKIENGPSVQVRLAVLEKSRGKFDAAITHLVNAARLDSLRTPQSLANIALQAGAIEFARGRYDVAQEWYREADDLFAGYWKTKLYLGEAALVAGETGKAAGMFEDVATDTNDPQAMDALAMLYRRMGNRQRSKEWASRASAEWERRVADIPSAYVAHAAEHELTFGDPARALVYARQNATTRPNGEAYLLLARALSANGQDNAAMKQLMRAKKSGWKSARLYVELAQLSAALGDDAQATEARAIALELNPRIYSPEATLIWFAHG